MSGIPDTVFLCGAQPVRRAAAGPYTPEQQVAYETMIADRYEVEPEYFAEKYNMPVGQRRNAPTITPDDEGSDGDDDGNGGDNDTRKNARPTGFFD